MLFSSTVFLFLFLPIVCLLHLLVRKELKDYVLLLASIFFYAWGEPRYVAVMLLTIIINYIGAILISKYKCKKLLLLLTILGGLSFLFYFKYFNFFVENINALFDGHIDFIKVIMPIGISFYTFQAISYVVDVYREEVEPQKNIYKLALYITLFPQLVAGPIVKYHDVADQIENRTVDFEKVAYGVKRFIVGLAKKVLLANTLGAVADKVFTQPIDQLDCMTTWLGAICYTFQIYYDFSGYSDMAIGLGSIFGFKFLENFNYPYISKSISEYWRRWHISLGSWFRDYMFLPLSRALTLSAPYSSLCKRIGRKLTNTLVTIISLVVVWFSTGFWHGAAWSFIVWGLYNGFFIFLEIMTGWNRDRKCLAGRVVQHIYALFVIILGFVIFRSDTMDYAWHYLLTMFGVEKGETMYQLIYYVDRIEIIALIVGAICSAPLCIKMLEVEGRSQLRIAAVNLWLLALFILSAASIAASTYNPFIYFRF